MSTAVATPASLGSWSVSQRKAASRIFAQALLSALPNASRNKAPTGAETIWRQEKMAPKEEKNELFGTRRLDSPSYYSEDSDFSDEESYSSYTESDCEDSSTFYEEV